MLCFGVWYGSHLSVSTIFNLVQLQLLEEWGSTPIHSARSNPASSHTTCPLPSSISICCKPPLHFSLSPYIHFVKSTFFSTQCNADGQYQMEHTWLLWTWLKWSNSLMVCCLPTINSIRILSSYFTVSNKTLWWPGLTQGMGCWQSPVTSRLHNPVDPPSPPTLQSSSLCKPTLAV